MKPTKSGAGAADKKPKAKFTAARPKSKTAKNRGVASDPRLVKVPAGQAPTTLEGRVVIEAVSPQVENGRVAAKRIVGESVSISADIFTDGHETIGAELLYRPIDEKKWRRTPMHLVENDRWIGHFIPERPLKYVFTIEAWRDPFASWTKDMAKRIAAAQDISANIEIGRKLVSDALEKAGEKFVSCADPQAVVEDLMSVETCEFMSRAGPHVDLSRYLDIVEIIVERRTACVSAWYELFPRSQSSDPARHGNFDDVIGRLGYIHDLGFDVLYLPPIHPIGTTNRKGRNNSLKALSSDPGSVYAIGSAEGGHMSVDPKLGTLEDFRRLIHAAKTYDIEIAIDLAIQCSLDHPWIKEHPDWFDWRPDGSIAFAENPPKKYEDIVNLRFTTETCPALWHALRDVVLFWIDQGVGIFRVDNPHTKPIPFWNWLISEINAKYPSVIFLAEAFTRPKMMRKLAKVGFQQSYTYFTWRNTKSELIAYISELAGDMSDYYRPNFFANTPDINPFYLQNGGRPGFIVRATLAALLSSNWGIYSGFELCESAAIPGREEYLDSEKYEIKVRDYDSPGNIKDHVRALNRIRNAHPALHDFRNVSFLNAWNDNIISFIRMTPNRDDCLLILANLDPHHAQSCSYEVPLWEFGLPDNASVEVEDLLRGNRFLLHGKIHQITLDPQDSPVVVWQLHGPQASEPAA